MTTKPSEKAVKKADRTISFRLALELLDALARLERREKTIRRDGHEVQAPHPYDFDGETLLAMAQNVNRIKAVTPVVRDMEVKLRAKHQGDKAQDRIDLAVAIEEMMDSDSGVNLVRIKFDALKMEANRIPATILAGLSPMIVGKDV